jgi:hypothetical protein
MEQPDKRLFEADLASAEFRNGMVNGWWGVPDDGTLPAGVLVWPRIVLWIAAAPRNDAPERYYLSLDLAGYRSAAPTGTFCDPATGSMLEAAKRPKGRAETRFARVFRTDWKGGRAFYHPYDRVAANGHKDWSLTQPHLVWTANHTIVDYLAEFHALLNSGDYLGI